MSDKAPEINANPSNLDWAASRGEKWRAQAAGMEPQLAPVDAPLIEVLRLELACRIADIGCGGGSTTVELFHRAPQGSIIHGYDIAPVLVEMARQRLKAGEKIHFEAADMAVTAPPSELYDRLLSRFGSMFFAEEGPAFANLYRWLKPGGRFAFAVWGPTAENPWFTVVRDVVAQVVELPKGDPAAPGPFRYADADKMLKLLSAAGFNGLEVQDWRGRLPIGGGRPAAQAASFALSSFSSFQEQLQKAGGTKFDQAVQLLTERYSALEEASSVQMDACVHIVTGMRPL